MKLTNMNFEHRSVFALYKDLIQEAYHVSPYTAKWIAEHSNADYVELSDAMVKYATTVLNKDSLESDMILRYFCPIKMEGILDKHGITEMEYYTKKREVIKQVARDKKNIPWLQFNMEPKGY